MRQVSGNAFSCTLFFRHDPSSLSWTEKYYLVGATDDKSTLAAGNGLAAARQTLLASDSYISEIRASQEGQRDSLVMTANSPGAAFDSGQSRQGVNAAKAEHPTLCITCRAESGPTHRRSIYLSGFGYGTVVSESNPFSLNAGWARNMLNFQNVLIANWGFLGLDLTNANPTVGIGNIDTGTAIITANGHGLQVGNNVRVSGVKFKPVATQPNLPIPNLNGIYTVNTVLNPNEFTLAGWASGIVLTNYVWNGLGTIRNQKYVVQPFTSVNPIKVGDHDRGNSFLRHRGRR